jgi:hypothetical protein
MVQGLYGVMVPQLLQGRETMYTCQSSKQEKVYLGFVTPDGNCGTGRQAAGKSPKVRKSIGSVSLVLLEYFKKERFFYR